MCSGPRCGLRIAGYGDQRRPASHPPVARPPPELNPKYTFEQFVIGPSNRLAHAAALSVAEMPSQAYNPLFIYGPPGLGKTHLLHSVGNYVSAFGGGLTVRYATAEEFTNAFLAALVARNLDEFKARFRGVDVLLIDDVQFLEGKARSEEELFHTFNALYDAGSQLVITCDRLPGDLADLEERLRERFAAGLVTDIERPDFATRLAILRKRAAHDGVALAADAAELLAARVTTNVRALEGALIRLVAYGSLTRRPLDRALVHDVLERLGLPLSAALAPSITAEIQDAACSALCPHAGRAPLALTRQPRPLAPSSGHVPRQGTDGPLTSDSSHARLEGATTPPSCYACKPRRCAHRRLAAGLPRYRGAHGIADAGRVTVASLLHRLSTASQHTPSPSPASIRAAVIHIFTAPTTAIQRK